MTSGSWRSAERSTRAKLSSIFSWTCTWLTPGSRYSTGSSTVMILRVRRVDLGQRGVERRRLAAAGRAGDEDHAAGCGRAPGATASSIGARHAEPRRDGAGRCSGSAGASPPTRRTGSAWSRCGRRAHCRGCRRGSGRPAAGASRRCRGPTSASGAAPARTRSSSRPRSAGAARRRCESAHGGCALAARCGCRTREPEAASSNSVCSSLTTGASFNAASEPSGDAEVGLGLRQLGGQLLRKRADLLGAAVDAVDARQQLRLADHGER